MVHSVERETIERPIIPGEFAEENVFEGTGFIRHITYEVHAPADRPLKRIALRDEIPGTVTASINPATNNTIVYRWEVNNVPRMFDEPSMPPYEDGVATALCQHPAGLGGRLEMVLELEPAASGRDHAGNESRQCSESDRRTQPTDMDKVKALFYFVSNKIRYMGITPEKDRPGFEPHDVCITFDKKYGVCRDKAALLVSMLRLAGLNAYPVLVSVGTHKDAEVPDPFFNHAIVGVELEKGQIMLMDPTDENTRELLPAYDRNQSYLVCRPEGDNIRFSPIQPPEENMMRIKTTGDLESRTASSRRSRNCRSRASTTTRIGMPFRT